MKTRNAPAARSSGVMAVLAAVLLGMAGPAMAVEHGFYISADYDGNRFDRDASGFDAMLVPFLDCQFAPDSTSLCGAGNAANTVLDQTRLNTRNHSYGLWVGYQLSDWFAVEGAYLDMGKIHYAFNGTIDLGPVDVDGDGNADFDGPQLLQGTVGFHTRGPALAAVGTLDLGGYFSVDARAGLFFPDNKLDLDMNITTPVGVYPFPYSESDSKTTLFYGVSGTFWITPYIGLSGGANAYQKGSFRNDVKQYFLGVRYSYGY